MSRSLMSLYSVLTSHRRHKAHLANILRYRYQHKHQPFAPCEKLFGLGNWERRTLLYYQCHEGSALHRLGCCRICRPVVKYAALACMCTTHWLYQHSHKWVMNKIGFIHALFGERVELYSTDESWTIQLNWSKYIFNFEPIQFKLNSMKHT